MALTEASAATASQLNFCTGLTLSQVFLPTLLPLNLLRVNLHFRVSLLGRPAKGEAMLCESFSETLQLPVLSEDTEKHVEANNRLIKAMRYNPPGCTGFPFYTGSSRNKENMQTNTA